MLLGQKERTMSISSLLGFCSGRSFSIGLFVVILIISFSIGLRFRAEEFQIPQQHKALSLAASITNDTRHNKRQNMTNELLRHTVATIGYRFQKAVTNSNENFGDFKIGKDTRTPNEIVNHMFDLLSKTKIFITEGHFNNSAPTRLDFNSEVERFHIELTNLDNAFSNNEFDINYSKRLLQGPLSDVMCHVGQIAMLSGLNGNKIQSEDYSSANIVTGKTATNI